LTRLDTLRRRSEILKRNIDSMIGKENGRGLSAQESRFYRDLIRKWHENEHEIHSANRRGDDGH